MKKEKEFIYLGDRLSAGGGCKAVVITRTRHGCAKPMECSKLFHGKRFLSKQKGAVWKSYDRPTIAY